MSSEGVAELADEHPEPVLDTGGRPVVVCSHRGPVSFSRDDAGALSARRGAGGLVTALLGLLPHLRDAVWVAHASGDADAEVAAGGDVGVAFEAETARVLGDEEEPSAPSLRIRPVVVDDEDHEAFYGVVSNPLLWFTQHGLYGLGGGPDVGPAEHEAWAAYRRCERRVRGGDGGGRPGRGRGARACARAAAGLPLLPRRPASAGGVPGRRRLPLHPHPLARSRRLARPPRPRGAASCWPGCSPATSSPSTRRTSRSRSC